MGNTIFKRKLAVIDDPLIQSVILEWKNVRTLSLRYSDRYCLFSLSIPLNVSEKDATAFLHSNIAWMRSTYITIQEKKSKLPVLNDQILDDFRRRIRIIINECEEAMNLKASSYTLKMMTSRWGSSQPQTRRISLNTKLALYPEECARYVVIHELAHFLHPNHSRSFWTCVEKFCPDYKELRQRLRN